MVVEIDEKVCLRVHVDLIIVRHIILFQDVKANPLPTKKKQLKTAFWKICIYPFAIFHIECLVKFKVALLKFNAQNKFGV